jgi:hypothetical protein
VSKACEVKEFWFNKYGKNSFLLEKLHLGAILKTLQDYHDLVCVAQLFQALLACWCDYLFWCLEDLQGFVVAMVCFGNCRIQLWSWQSWWRWLDAQGPGDKWLKCVWSFWMTKIDSSCAMSRDLCVKVHSYTSNTLFVPTPYVVFLVRSKLGRRFITTILMQSHTPCVFLFISLTIAYWDESVFTGDAGDILTLLESEREARRLRWSACKMQVSGGIYLAW